MLMVKIIVKINNRRHLSHEIYYVDVKTFDEQLISATCEPQCYKKEAIKQWVWSPADIGDKFVSSYHPDAN